MYFATWFCHFSLDIEGRSTGSAGFSVLRGAARTISERSQRLRGRKMARPGGFLLVRTMSGALRCLRGGYYMREEVRERIFTIHPVLYDVRAVVRGIALGCA